jgi:hypothetical protein
LFGHARRAWHAPRLRAQWGLCLRVLFGNQSDRHERHRQLKVPIPTHVIARRKEHIASFRRRQRLYSHTNQERNE